MGLLDRFKKQKGQLSAPATGTLKPIETLADGVFSEKMMGEGFIIENHNGEIYSPVSGVVQSVFPTKHAVTIVSDEGVEVLLHIGLDTVELQGQGFDVKVAANDKVTKDTLLVTADIDYLKSQEKPTALVVVFPSNPELTFNEELEVEQGQLLREL